MKIHEYQAKDLFRKYHIPTPKGYPAGTIEAAKEVFANLAHGPIVVKAQIHAGGRGKGGGVIVAGNPDEALKAVSRLLGTALVTPQTGEDGKPVSTVLIEESLAVAKEIYLGITIDRTREGPVIISSGKGGMEIERIARTSPEEIHAEFVSPDVGLRPFQVTRLFFDLGIDPSLSKTFHSITHNLYRLFLEKDCSIAEINPLVVTTAGELVALDGKLNLDDNALYRHPDISALRDTAQENLLEVKASRHNLNYIKLKGNVGCMVNGAGLAMATMDLIKLAGAEPANFLDVGGGATSDMVREGLKILVSDPDVKVILINIFGGILRCDTLARGVVEAAKELVINLPVVVRLEGTNVDTGRKILDGSGLAFCVAADMQDAAQKVAARL